MRDLGETIFTLQKSKRELTALIAKAHDEQIEVNASVTAIRGDIANLKSIKYNLLSENTTLRDSIDTLNIEKGGLEEEINTIANAKAILTKQHEDFERTYDETSRSKKQELALLDAKILENTQKLAEAQNSEEMVRRNLSTRLLALDQREENLSLRERKLLMNEDAIQRNANLLNL